MTKSNVLSRTDQQVDAKGILRRDVIFGLSSLFVASLFGCSTLPAPIVATEEKSKSKNRLRPFFVGAHSDQNIDDLEDFFSQYAPEISGYISVIDPENSASRQWPVPLLVHGLAQNPKMPTKILGVAKWTPSAVVIDITTGVVEKLIRAPEGYSFFGHGEYSQDGAWVLISIKSKDPSRHNGGLAIYDSQSWRLDKVIDVGFASPHQLICLETGDYVLAGGYRASQQGNVSSGVILHLDARTLAIKNQFSTKSVDHLRSMGGSKILACGGNKFTMPWVVMIDLASGYEVKMSDSPDFQSKMRCQALSQTHFDDTAAITLPGESKIALWDYKKQRVRYIDFPAAPKGIIYHNQRLFVSYGQRGDIAILDAVNPKQMIHASEVIPSQFSKITNGKHLYLAWA